MGLGGIFGKIGKVLGQAAPIVGGLLGGPAAGAITSILSQTLGVKDEPDAVLHALENDPSAVERIRTLEIQQKSDLTRLQITAETARIVSDNTADTERLAEVNKTMRVEASSADPVGTQGAINIHLLHGIFLDHSNDSYSDSDHL